jgi:hypothetical protein
VPVASSLCTFCWHMTQSGRMGVMVRRSGVILLAPPQTGAGDCVEQCQGSEVGSGTERARTESRGVALHRNERKLGY